MITPVHPALISGLLAVMLSKHHSYLSIDNHTTGGCTYSRSKHRLPKSTPARFGCFWCSGKAIRRNKTHLHKTFSLSSSMDSSKTNAVRSPAPRRLHAYEDLPRPAKHPLQSDADEESAPAKRLRSSDNEEEDNPEATVDVNGVNTQQIRHDQPQLQQREDREDYPPASKRQVNLMCRLKYNNTFRMGEQVVVVHTMNTIKKNKTGNPCEYSYNLRGIHLPAEMIANIFSHMGFRTLGKACMGKNTKASKMHGKIVVSSAELKRRFHEHDLHTFFLRNGIPYSPAMAATLGVNSSWAYVLVLFRFMLEKGCHGCGAGVYIGCHYWAFGQNFCGNCLKDKLIHVSTAVRPLMMLC